MDLIVALLDTSRHIADPRVAAIARSLTIDWTRFKYFGPIVEGEELEALLAEASEHGKRWCLVQAHGHVLSELWTPEGAAPRDALTILERWVEGRELLAAGFLEADGSPEKRCLLVDLQRWNALGRPSLSAKDAPIEPFPPELEESCLDLQPEDPASAAVLAACLGDGIADFNPEAPSPLSPTARGFLATMRRLTANLRRGVFLWNVESYADVEQPPDELGGPLQALYSVAAGLKPNRVLETHGFEASTRMVYFDYSQTGLRFRRILIDEWDGRDYPAFLRRLFTLLPSDEAHYCLWEGVTPETLDWDDVEMRWRQELDAWGGEDTLARHWARYRELPHTFAHCDLLGDIGPLLEQLRDEPRAAIWWSNAYFSFVSNWSSTAGERRLLYRRFISALAERAPHLYLYGASSDNISVNAVQAAEYHRWYEEAGGDELEPGKLHRLELRF